MCSMFQNTYSNYNIIALFIGIVMCGVVIVHLLLKVQYCFFIKKFMCLNYV
jgi:hypothetical protein